MKKGDIKVNAFLNTAKTVLGIIFPLITFPYVSRVLQVDAIGIYNFSASINSYFLLIAGLGVSTYAIREGAIYRDNKEKTAEFVSEVFSINLIATCIAYILLFLCLLTVPQLGSYKTPILILSVEILFSTLGINWIYNIYEDFLFITIRTLCFQIISLIATFAFVRNTNDLMKYVLIVAFSSSGANVVNFLVARKKYCKFRFTFHCNWKDNLKPILVIFSTTVAINVYVNADTTILGILTNDYQVGLYSTAAKIYTIIKNVLAAMLTVLIPRFSLLINKNNLSNANELFSKVFNTMSILLLPISVGLFMTSSDVILLVAGKNYLAGSEALKLLSVATIFSLFAYMYTQCILIPAKEENIVFKATLISAVANIILNLVLIPIFGMNAAAFTTIIAEFIVFYIAFKESNKIVKLEGIKRNLITVFWGCVIIIVVCAALDRLIQNAIIRLFASVFVSGILYGVTLILMRNEIVLELISRVKRNIIKKRIE